MMDIRSALRVQSSIICSLILIQIILPTGSIAEVSDTIQITATDDGETWPRIVDDPDGNIHIVYLFSSDVNQLLYRKITRTGTTLIGPVILNKIHHGLYSRYDYDLAIDNEGRIHVVYHAFIEEESHLYYVLISKSGKIIVPSKELDCSSNKVDHPDIDVDELGNVYIVFNDRVSRPSIRWIQLSSGGEILSSEETISDLCFDVWTPKLCVTPTGVSHIIWLQRDTRLERWGIYYTRLSVIGNRALDPVEVDQSSLLFDKSYIKADLDSEDCLHITYMQDDNIYYAQINKNGSPIVSHLLITPSTTGDSGTSDIVVSSSNDAYIVYEFIEQPEDLQYEIDLRVYWKKNNTLGKETILHTSGISSEDPCISISDEKIVEVVYWQWDLIQDLYLITVGAETTNPPPINVTKPTANILDITPNPGIEDHVITFTGSGIDPEGKIVAYRWESNLDGFLSDQRNFTTSQLSVGDHQIRFQVQDNEDFWSEHTTEPLIVLENSNPIVIKTSHTEGVVDQELEFIVAYRNINNTPPVYSRIYYGQNGDNNYERLIEVDVNDHDISNGKDYHVTIEFHESGVYSYYFEFYNNEDGEQLSEIKEISIRDGGDINTNLVFIIILLIILIVILVLKYKTT